MINEKLAGQIARSVFVGNHLSFLAALRRLVLRDRAAGPAF